MAEDKRDDNIRTLPLRDNGEGLTARQVKVLEVIRSAVATRGYPPSLREIGDAVGLTSPSSVAHQLTARERIEVLLDEGTFLRDQTLALCQRYGTQPPVAVATTKPSPRRRSM